MSASDTKKSSTYPNIVFANISQTLDTISYLQDNVSRFVIDPITITYDLFKKSFYSKIGAASGATLDLALFNPSNTTESEINQAKIKNILFLSSGGGTITIDGTSVTLPTKTITFGNRSPEQFIYTSLIIKTIEDEAGAIYDTWSIDSQIAFSKKISQINYLYDFTIKLKTTANSNNTSEWNTNALDWEDLSRMVNLYLYKSALDRGESLTDGTPQNVILNFVVAFNVILDDNKADTANPNIKIELLFQYHIPDYPFSSTLTI